MNASALHAELVRLEGVFDAALRAALPNVVALTFSDLRLDFQGKRDLVFALDLLEEGENEAALIAGLAAGALAHDPDFDVAHLVREAWYYLRTSIDPVWQFDDEPASFDPALEYIGAVLRARIARLPPCRRSAGVIPADERRALLARLRSQPPSRVASRIER